MNTSVKLQNVHDEPAKTFTDHVCLMFSLQYPLVVTKTWLTFWWLCLGKSRLLVKVRERWWLKATLTIRMIQNVFTFSIFYPNLKNCLRSYVWRLSHPWVSNLNLTACGTQDSYLVPCALYSHCKLRAVKEYWLDWKRFQVNIIQEKNMCHSNKIYLAN